MTLAHARRTALRLTCLVALLAFAIIALMPRSSRAADFFIRETIAESGVAPEDARAATALVRNAVASRAADQAVEAEAQGAYVLQPHLIRLGDSWILTVEKVRGQEILFAAQSKINRIDQLDGAARSTVFAAIDEPSPKSIQAGQVVPYQVTPAYPSTQAAHPTVVPLPGTIQGTSQVMPQPTTGASVGRTINVLPAGRKVSYWTIGMGPSVGQRLKTDNVMYDIAAGHIWDVNPRASVKLMGEGAFTSGNETGHFVNFSTGVNYFFPTMTVDTSPYLTTDIGYGFARDAQSNVAEGFSWGLGIGYQFFRATETTLDLLLRYATIFDPIGDTGNPSVIGARLAVNF